MFECEVRGFFKDETTFQQSLTKLKAEADRYEEDHRATTFFMMKDATLKVAHLQSKGKAKIAFKAGDIVHAKAQREIELSLAPDDVANAVAMFEGLGFHDIQQTSQTRYNLWFDEIEVAMKWSKDWGYHFEAELIGQTESDIASNLQRLHIFCENHDLKIVASDEFEAFRQQIDAKHKASS